jgi:hypothetical protein
MFPALDRYQKEAYWALIKIARKHSIRYYGYYAAVVRARRRRANAKCFFLSPGFRHRSEPVVVVQYHPESAPGPHDSFYLFTGFVKMMDEWNAPDLR